MFGQSKRLLKERNGEISALKSQLDHLEADQRKEAKRAVRQMMMGERGPDELPERSRRRLSRDVLFGGSS